MSGHSCNGENGLLDPVVCTAGATRMAIKARGGYEAISLDVSRSPHRWDGVVQRLSIAKLGSWSKVFAIGVKRRRAWFLENLTVPKLMNMLIGTTEFALKQEKLKSQPVAVKIDISPLCNLRCTHCIHAKANGNPALEKQQFNSKQRMTVEQYRRIIEEIKETATVVSLYYLGDPIVHPDMDEMCRIARDAKLNVHISTNFSLPLSDERIRSIVTSGLTHLTVCVDGLSQGKYQMTRVGGRIDLVLSNLRRVCQYRRKLRRRYPQVEVQYIKFQHNVDELEDARRILTEFGVDRVTDFWGGLDNYTDRDPGNYDVFEPKQNKKLPQCFWTHFSMVIKYNGDVIPCCCHRHGSQYTEKDDPLVLGNVFETSVREVWNSLPYQQTRRLVNNPEAIKSESILENNFCYACTQLFDTNRLEKVYRPSNKYRFEELYTLSANGRPIRRREAVSSGSGVSSP